MLAPAPSGARLALQGSGLWHLGKVPADLEDRRRRIERKPRRDSRLLTSLAIGIERAFARNAIKAACFAGNQ
jgi:hypothetical protein